MYIRYCASYPLYYRDYEDYHDYRHYRNEGCNKCKSKITLDEQVVAPSNFKLSYPFVPNTENNPTYDKVNKSLIACLSTLFNEQVLLPEKINFIEVVSFYKVPLNEKGLLSVLFGLYTFTGGAHGYTAYTSVTLDYITGKVYEFNDLFNPKFNYKPFINELAQKYIKENNISLIADYTGITPDQKYYLTEDSLVLYYQLYEFTPYAHGIFEIRIPYTDIKNLITPLSPINRLLIY